MGIHPLFDFTDGCFNGSGFQVVNGERKRGKAGCRQRTGGAADDGG